MKQIRIDDDAYELVYVALLVARNNSPVGSPDRELYQQAELALANAEEIE